MSLISHFKVKRVSQTPPLLMTLALAEVDRLFPGDSGSRCLSSLMHDRRLNLSRLMHGLFHIQANLDLFSARLNVVLVVTLSSAVIFMTFRSLFVVFCTNRVTSSRI